MEWEGKWATRSATVWWMRPQWYDSHVFGKLYPNSNDAKSTRPTWTSKMIDYYAKSTPLSTQNRFPPLFSRAIPPRRNVTFTLNVDHCKGVNFLEHVQARISLTTQRRGDIMIFLTSPSGTRTCLLTERWESSSLWLFGRCSHQLFPQNSCFLLRVHDVSRSGFNDWPFMTVHQWGESPQGVWQLEINNKGRFMGKQLTTFLNGFTSRWINFKWQLFSSRQNTVWL